MTTPRTPGDAITGAAQRLSAQREATRQLAEELAAKRRAEAESTSDTSPQEQL